jgi:hypothetical protein
MRIGTGVVLLVLGAFLYAAVDVDLPHVKDDALGLIMLLGGLVTIVIAVINKIDRPELGIGTGLLLIAAGAILAVAVRVELPHVAAYELGSALVSAGILTLIATVGTIVGRRPRRPRRTDNVRPDGIPEPETGPMMRPDLAVIPDRRRRRSFPPASNRGDDPTQRL